MSEVAALAYQLQTLGLARSEDREALEAAADELNAQNVQIVEIGRGYRWLMMCDPQPQDCGPVGGRDAT